MSSSDSDSDENLEALKEAVDIRLAINFAPRDVPPVRAANIVCEKIANNSRVQDSFDSDLKPAMKNHIAKKLVQIIDSKIKLSKRKPVQSRVESSDDEDGGVQLFSSTKRIISVEMDLKSGQTGRLARVWPKQRKRNGSMNSEDEATKLASATVDASWVLAKRGVYSADQREADFVVSKNGDCRETRKNSKSKDCLVNGSSPEQQQHEPVDEHPPPPHRSACRKKKKRDSREPNHLKSKRQKKQVHPECA